MKPFMGLLALYFLAGAAVPALVSIVWVWRRKADVRRASISLALIVVPFALSMWLWTSHPFGPLKTLGNLVEFPLYGIAAGGIPLGQLIAAGRRYFLGELSITVAACIVATAIFSMIRTFPETTLG